MHELPIRRARSADLASLLPMMEDFNAGEHIPWDRSRFEQALAPLLHDDTVGIVAIAGEADRAIGYAIVTWGYDLEFAGRDAFLTELYVRPAVRGEGRGDELLAWVEAAARAAGAGALHLMVRPDNTAARRLYARRGFVAPPRDLLSKPL